MNPISNVKITTPCKVVFHVLEKPAYLYQSTFTLKPKWFGSHVVYTMSKYGMSMIVMGLAEELRSQRIGVNALWPRTTIATAAVQNLLGGDFLIQRSRTPQIVADAAYYILQQPSFECTGNFFIDEEVLRKQGETDFSKYAVNPQQKLMTDLFVD